MDRVRGVDCGKVQDPQDLGYIPRFRLFGREVFGCMGGWGLGNLRIGVWPAARWSALALSRYIWAHHWCVRALCHSKVDGSVPQTQFVNLGLVFEPDSQLAIVILFFSFTLVTGPRSSLSLQLSGTRVYEPQIRTRPKPLDINRVTS
jgi:hypothetical protein